jgi:DNA repair protein RecO (recombination protein O)
MALVTTDAIVLRTYNLAEADRIVVCLTSAAGLVRAVAKGARKMKSRFGAALEPFMLVRLSYYERENRELVNLSSAEILKSHFNLNSQPESAEVLAYVAELVCDFAPPHESDDKLFRMVIACVDSLEAKPESSRALIRYFEIWLLRLAGMFPDVQLCSECGSRLGGSETVNFDYELRPYCRECRPQGSMRLLAETRETILSSRRVPPAEFATQFEQVSDESSTQLGELTHRLIVRALERRPRTLAAVQP